MTPPPSLGVLITYHDEGEFLRECVHSLLEGSEHPDEILVYDDASRLPARDFVPAEWPVKIIRGEKNVGPAMGRNALLKAATSECIHFHDADDWFHPQWCAKVRSRLEDRSIDAVFTEVSSFIDGRLHVEKVIGLEGAGDDLVRFSLIHTLLVPSGTYRAQAVKSIGGYRPDLWQSEDFDFHVRLAASGIRYALIPEPLACIRLHPGSRSRNLTEVWRCRLDAVERLVDELPERHRPDISEAALGIGSKLFQLRLRTEAREAFRLALELGPPRYDDKSKWYRNIAQALGPEAAEWAGVLYRNLLPEPLRRKLKAAK